MQIKLNSKKLSRFLDRLSVGKFNASIEFVIEPSGTTIAVQNDDGVAIYKPEVSVIPTERFGFSLPYQTTVDAIKRMGEEFTINFEKSTATLRSGSFVVKQMIMEFKYDEYMPQYERNEYTTRFQVDLDAWKKLVSKTADFVSYETFKPTLRGICLDVKKDVFSMVATDGKRLCIAEDRIEHDGDFQVIVPVHVAKKVAVEANNFVNIKMNNNLIYFQYDDTILIASLLEGKYPNYAAIVPSQFTHRLVVNKTSLVNALGRVSIFSAKDLAGRVRFEITKESATVRSSSNELGEAEEVFDCENMPTEQSLKFMLNYKYLDTVLKNIDGEDIVMNIVGNGSDGKYITTTPIKIIDAKEGERFVFIVMPLTMQEGE